VARLRLRRARTPIKRLDPHPPHQRLHMTTADLAPIENQKTTQHAGPRERELGVQLVDLPHEREVYQRKRARQVVHRAAREADNLGLLRYAQSMIAVDHSRRAEGALSAQRAQQSRLGERAF